MDSSSIMAPRLGKIQNGYSWEKFIMQKIYTSNLYSLCWLKNHQNLGFGAMFCFYVLLLMQTMNKTLCFTLVLTEALQKPKVRAIVWFQLFRPKYHKKIPNKNKQHDVDMFVIFVRFCLHCVSSSVSFSCLGIFSCIFLVFPLNA